MDSPKHTILTVSHKGAKLTVTIETSKDQEATLGDLKQALESLTAVPVSHQKLLHKQLTPTTPNTAVLTSLKLVPTPDTPSPAPIMLVGSSTAAVDKIMSESRTLEVKKHRELKDSAVLRDIHRREAGEKAIEDSRFTFMGIEVLPGFSDQAAARKVLERLRDDIGIRGIMKKHQWNVFLLKELHPAEQTILGYNQNKGQVICVRIRTDDLKGFRHYPSIRQVLLHELAHMVHSAHDEHFHALNRQLNKECEAFGNGHSVSEGRFFQSSTDESIDQGGLKGGTFVLGGESLATSSQGSPNREILAKAALLRLSKEEQEIVDGCGSSHSSPTSKQ